MLADLEAVATSVRAWKKTQQLLPSAAHKTTKMLLSFFHEFLWKMNKNASLGGYRFYVVLKYLMRRELRRRTWQRDGKL
jgi:hypothetical protein